MRPQQQNRRMRGRNNSGGGGNNNRKGPNPLNRNYESNGPDVKIRGSAQQIAEKYATLARDAMSSGDRVMAENYLQHAEHYNRIIAAAQAQMPIQHVQPNRDEFEDDLDEDREELESGATSGEGAAPAVNHGAGPQPVIEGTPAEVALNADGDHDGNGGGGRNRDRRGQNGRRGEFSQGSQRAGQRSEQKARDEQVTGEQAQQSAQAGHEDATAQEAASAQPAVASTSPAALAAMVESNEKAAKESGDEEAAPRRARRPRRPRVSAAEAAASEETQAPAEAAGGEVAANAES